MSIRYAVREGLAGFKRARLAAFASTSAFVVALVLIGVIVLAGLQARSVSSWLRQRVGEMELFLEQVEDEQARRLQEEIDARPAVAQTEYISQEEAEKIFREEFGEGGDIFLEETFLPASIRVRVEPEYARPDSLEQLARAFGERGEVSEVVFNQPLLVKVQRNLRWATLVALGVGILVIMAVLFLVANTVRLTIYARRLLIRTMKLVGATDRFVRRPFLVEGMVQGFIAGLIAAGVLWGGLVGLEQYLPQLSQLTWPGGDVRWTIGGVIPLGVILGYFGSRLASRRFITQVALR